MFTILALIVALLHANLECRTEMWCTRLAESTRRKNSPSTHHRATLSGYRQSETLLNSNLLLHSPHVKWLKCIVKWLNEAGIEASACARKLRLRLRHVLTKYGELRPTNGWDRLASLGNFSEFGDLASWSSVYTIQPVVKPVVKPVWQPVVSCIQTFSRLSTGLTTGCIV